jgi:hypothetical protein
MINFGERLQQKSIGIDKPSTELYQDATHYTCSPNRGARPADDDSYKQPEPEGMSITDKLLQRVLDIMGGGNIGGAYRSVKITIPALEQRYEIQLGIYATQLSIRCDKDITLVLNNPQFDSIFLEIADFPVSISSLRMNETIHTLYITTTVDTEFQVVAFGSVKLT